MYKNFFSFIALCSLAFFSYSQNSRNAEGTQSPLTKSYITSLGTFTIELYDNSTPLPEQLDYTEESYTASDGGVIKYLVTKATMEEDNVITPENFQANIYPNPFSDEAIITVQNSGFDIQSLRIKFYDLFGKEIFLPVIRNHEQFIIHKNTLPDGMYFYQVLSQNGTNVSSGKFIVSTTH